MTNRRFFFLSKLNERYSEVDSDPLSTVHWRQWTVLVEIGSLAVFVGALFFSFSRHGCDGGRWLWDLACWVAACSPWRY
jgi:hypothetical protein